MKLKVPPSLFYYPVKIHSVNFIHPILFIIMTYICLVCSIRPHLNHSVTLEKQPQLYYKKSLKLNNNTNHTLDYISQPYKKKLNLQSVKISMNNIFLHLQCAMSNCACILHDCEEFTPERLDDMIWHYIEGLNKKNAH